MSIRLKFSENFHLSDAKCDRNNQNLKQTKTFRDFRVFNFVDRAKSKTRKPRKFSVLSHIIKLCFFVSGLFLVFGSWVSCTTKS